MASTIKQECAGYLKLRKEQGWIDESTHRKACYGEAVFHPPDSKIPYCVIHAPDPKKATKFNRILKDKLSAKDYCFSGAWFPADVSFYEHHFENDADFSDATFTGTADFSKTSFQGDCTFTITRFKGGAFFEDAHFTGSSTDFHEAVFDDDANFLRAAFIGNVDFSKAEFKALAQFFESRFNGGNAVFIETKFTGRGADFRNSVFDSDVEFTDAEFSFGEARFSGTRFGGTAEFRGALFEGNGVFVASSFKRKADFTDAEFNAKNYFYETKFHGDAVFNSAQFNGELRFQKADFKKKCLFVQTKFDDIYLSSARFRDLDFSHARFTKQADFEYAEISGIAVFSKAIIADRFKLNGKSVPKIEFKDAEIENPEKLSLRNIALRPHWFVRADIRQVNFFNVDWSNNDKGFASEIEALKDEKDDQYPLLENTYRQIATNAEDNARYTEAMAYRYLSLEMHRKRSWRTRYLPVTLHWWYWFSSGYGERSPRALFVLIGIWLTFSLLYFSPISSFSRWETKVSNSQEYQTVVSENKTDTEGRKLNLTEALAYSFGVMALQKPEPKPLGAFTYGLVLFETVLGPLQAALLALAIRRKFMR